MDCTATSIKELLPSYLEGALGLDDRASVERHLAGCPDCADELALLRTLAEDPVPDPGNAFWGSMPERIHGELRREQRKGRRSRLFALFTGPAIPRWGWATAAAVMIAVVSLLLLRPAHHRLPAGAVHRQAPAPDIISEALNGTEIRPGDLGRLSAWAHQELLALRSGLGDASIDTADAFAPGMDLEDELAALSDEELELLIDTLSARNEEESV